MVLILWSFSSSPSLSFCHSVMPPFLSLYITLPFLSLYHAVSVHCFAGTLLCPFFFFFCYFAWCLVFGWWENMGKQREIYILLFWYDLWIYTWFWVFFFFLLGAWCLDDEKMWETKGKLAFSFSLICLVSKKLEATKSRPNQTDWNPVSSVSVPNLVKPKISVRWKNRSSNRPNRTDYTPPRLFPTNK